MPASKREGDSKSDGETKRDSDAKTDVTSSEPPVKPKATEGAASS
jgi:hypothetical protein